MSEADTIRAAGPDAAAGGGAEGAAGGAAAKAAEGPAADAGRGEPQPAPASTLGKAWRMLSAADRRRAAAALGASLLSAALSSLMVWSVIPFMRLLFDPGALAADPTLAHLHALAGRPDPYDALLALGAASAALILLGFLAQLLQVVMITRFSAELNRGLGRRLLASYLGQPYEFFLGQHSAALSANILSEAEQAASEVYRPAIQLAAGLMTTAAILAVLVGAGAGAAMAAAAAVLAAHGAVYIAVRRRMRRLGAARYAANRARFLQAGEGLQSIKDVKVLGREGAYLSRYDRPAAALAAAETEAQLVGAAPLFALRAGVILGGVALCLALVGREDFLSGDALGSVAPTLGLLAVAGQRLLPEVQRIAAGVAKLQFGAASVERLHAHLFALSPPAEAPDGPRLPLRRALRLEGLSYRYPGAEAPGLEGIDLTLPAGRRIGLVGRSGAGKSTLGDIALGLLPPSQGRLLADGRAIATDADRALWRRSVGFVPQDVFLADASVAENIALGLERAEIDMDRVRDCARMARIDAVAAALPDGYDTTVGERGVRLSGGQRQRLAIARALYRDAELIVFDEATSALDAATEAEVMEALAALPGDRTILLIAHRLGTLDACDLIVTLDGGRVAGVGTRAELEATCPAFRELARLGGDGEAA